MTRTISGTYTTLVTLSAATDQPTQITKSADLGGGLATYYAGLTVTNAGQISTTAGVGVSIASGGSITNQSGGTITGVAYGIAAGGTLTVLNTGLVSASSTGAYSSGVFLANGGMVTNSSSGTIAGNRAVRAAGSALTVSNYGFLLGTGSSADQGAGITDQTGGAVTNHVGGTISGGKGINANGLALVVTNDGVIIGTDSDAIHLSGGGSVTNQSGGTITGGAYGIYAGASLTILNTGLISASPTGAQSPGVFLNQGGAVTNGSSGTITGNTAVRAGGSVALTVSNYGVLLGTVSSENSGAGIIDPTGGTITNHAAGTISGGEAINGNGLALALTNDGMIVGTDSDAINLFGGGSLTNQSGGTITGYGNGLYSARAMTVVNAGQITGNKDDAIGLLNGGNVVNAAGGVLRGYGSGIFIDSGDATVTNAGTIASTGNGNAVRFGAGYINRLIVDPGAVFTGRVDGGNTVASSSVSTLELAGTTPGTLSGIGSQITNFSRVTVDAGASWQLIGDNTLGVGVTLSGPGSLTIGSGGTLALLGSITAGGDIAFTGGSGELATNTPSFPDQIDGFVQGDTIQLNGVTDGTAATISNSNTLVVTRSSNPDIDLVLDPTRSYVGHVFTINSTGAVTDETPCFLRGTRIRTVKGEVPVENLRLGDLVRTLSGRPRPITWIGTCGVAVRPGQRTAATPILVTRSAIAPGIPDRDLRVTKGHSFFIDNVLIPAEFLVNHRSIRWDDHARIVEFYHIELDAHDILLANGTPAESYRDDGNRSLFQNANPAWANPDWNKPPAPACAPVLTGGATVDTVWRRLLDRAGERPSLPLTRSPSLHLAVDGRRMDPAISRARTHLFRLPRRPGAVHLRSRSAAPAELGLARDPRPLGVPVKQIGVWQGAKLHLFDLTGAERMVGFHGYEPDQGIRWTDGEALLPQELFIGLAGEIHLQLWTEGETWYPA